MVSHNKQSKPSSKSVTLILPAMSDPERQTQNLLASMQEASKAVSARAYFLSLINGQYEAFPSGKSEDAIDLIHNSSAPDNIRFLASAVDRGVYVRLGCEMFIPVMQHETCIVIVALTFSDDKHPSLMKPDQYVDTAQAFHNPYLFRFVVLLMTNLKEPIGFEDTTPTNFYDSIVNTVANAAGVGMVALRRQTDSGVLEYLAGIGFQDHGIPSMSFTPGAIPQPFTDAIQTQRVQYVKNANSVPEMRDRKLFSSVKSFVVVPIRVGAEVLGTLSFATPITYTFSELELLGLETIANGVGVALTNFHNYLEREKDFDKLGDLAVSMSAVDVSQSVRHESIGYIGRAQDYIAHISRRPKSTISEQAEQFDKLSDTLKLIENSLAKIKLATKPPEKELKEVGIKDIWDEACNLLREGRLKPYNISTPFDGENVTIALYPDWVRTALFNLILNSYDAYKRGNSTGAKTITLRVTDCTETQVKLEYIDNAGGVEINKLHIPGSRGKGLAKGGDLNKILFEPGVSSKGKDGAGYGMYLIRKGIQVHAGASINLIRYRGGVTFEIILPRTLKH